MKLKFECKTEQERIAAEEFLSWLCNSGEQGYWDGMESPQFDADADGKGDITIVKFDYDFKKLEAKLTLGHL